MKNLKDTKVSMEIIKHEAHRLAELQSDYDEIVNHIVELARRVAAFDAAFDYVHSSRIDSCIHALIDSKRILEEMSLCMQGMQVVIEKARMLDMEMVYAPPLAPSLRLSDLFK